MHLSKRVGTPCDPVDPALIEKRADALFDYAVSVSGCETPLIALNELWGASLPTPLTPTAERYRANVLRFVSRLASRGGRPALLVSSEPFTGGDAATWWRSIGAVSDLVLENYANANLIWRDGPVDGSRRLRVRYRRSAAKLLAIGIPASRIGIMIGFQTGPGTGGREGLKPRSRWFDVDEVAGTCRSSGRARVQARACLVVGLGATGRAIERSRQDVRARACGCGLATRAFVTLRPILGHELDPDLKTGQLSLPAGTRCIYGSTPLTASSVASLAKVTKDRELALTALVVRADRAGALPRLAVGRARARAADRSRAVRWKRLGVSSGAGEDGREPGGCEGHPRRRAAFARHPCRAVGGAGAGG